MSKVERRRSPRVTVADHPELPAGIVDVGLGGLSVALPYGLAMGSVHDIGLTLTSGADIVLRVRVAHRRRESRPDGPDVFVTGLEFLADVTDQASLGMVRIAS